MHDIPPHFLILSRPLARHSTPKNLTKYLTERQYSVVRGSACRSLSLLVWLLWELQRPCGYREGMGCRRGKLPVLPVLLYISFFLIYSICLWLLLFSLRCFCTFLLNYPPVCKEWLGLSSTGSVVFERGSGILLDEIATAARHDIYHLRFLIPPRFLFPPLYQLYGISQRCGMDVLCWMPVLMQVRRYSHSHTRTRTNGNAWIYNTYPFFFNYPSLCLSIQLSILPPSPLSVYL